MSKWRSGYAGEHYASKEKSVAASGDAPDKKDKKLGKVSDTGKDRKGKPKEDKGKGKEDPKAKKDDKSKGEKDAKVTEKGPSGAKGKGKKEPEQEPEEIPLTPSEIAREEAEYRAMERQRNLRKRHWPEVTKVKINTKPWSPPGPPEKMPRVMIELPPLETRRWVPPYMRKRRLRPKLLRIAPEEITRPPTYENTLRKIWHGFAQVDTNKMMLQGSIGCNSKRYSSTASGSQTGCIALVARALLDEKSPAELVRRDVDDVIDAGDRFYRSCMTALKCYKGKPQLELNQINTNFFFRDKKFIVTLNEVDRGILAKNPDNLKADADLMQLMEKRAGSQYMMILTVGGDRHFLIWGHPPEAAGQVRTVCYIFDPHMLDEFGTASKLYGAGAFLRYPGVTSFVLDFLNNHGDLSAANKASPKPKITLTNIEVVQKEPLIRDPGYDLDLKALKTHCQSEWESMNTNALIDQKRYHGKYPLASLSAVSLATSRKSSRRKLREFFQKSPPKEPQPMPPIAPEKPPPQPTAEQIMQLRGEDFFLHCPKTDAHTFGRDDLIPLPKSETVLHSPVEIADQNFHSQYNQLDVGKWILRATRHFASYRYQTFKSYTGVACCVAALGVLRRLRARAWNEDTLDETLDIGYNLFRESLLERGGPIRRLVLGELKEDFTIRDKDYKHKERGIAIWGKLISNNPKVFDLCRGIEAFFREADSGILQIPGEYETAIWNEGGKFYVYHPWPADRYGTRVGLQGGGRACLLAFGRVSRLCEHFMDNVKDLRRRPYSISEIAVFDLGERPEPVNKMKPIAAARWLVRGSFHEGDERFPEEHRNKQATPTAIAAVAMASLLDPADWTPNDIDEVLIRGDILYEKTMEHLDKLGINLETPPPPEEGEGEEEEGASGTAGTLAAADVLPRFRVGEYDCIETDIVDSAYSGQLNPEPRSGVMSLKNSLRALFKDNRAAVVTARGSSVAVWRHNNYLYFFDPHGCDENGLPSDDSRAGACLIRMKNNVSELADVIMGNLAPGSDDSFNISPVDIIASKLNAEIGAPETKLENKAFEWLNRGTAAILMGPRGENTAIGKAAHKANIPLDDLAGRTLALPAIAAFTAAADAVPPPGMHLDHMYNFLDAGKDYYLNHVKKTGRKDIKVEDLSEKFEMGANTFSIEVGEATRLPLRLPDKIGEGGGEEEEEDKSELGEGMEEMPKKETMKQMKDLLFKMWYDTTKPTTVSLLLGDYHQLGVWMAPEGKVVVFDPAPTLAKGLLTPQRKAKGDQLRLQRLKDEMPGEGGDEEEADEEDGAEGEEKPEPEPEFVPPESCPALMVFASPGEFIDKLVEKGGLDPKQAIAPYWLYPVTVTNELTSVLKDKRPGARGDAEAEGAAGEEEEETLVEPLDDAAMGKYFMRMSRAIASCRGRVAQNENYFMDQPNRDNQDAANCVMAIVVEHIEPYEHWKPSLIDAILKYGDRLYTTSYGRAPPRLAPAEVQTQFHVTNFNIKLDIDGSVINGDIKAGETGSVLSLKRGLKKFFEGGYNHGVICAKDYCAAVWQASDGKALCYWDPHPIGPIGKTSPGGAAGLVLFSNLDDLAETYKSNVDSLARPGTNKYSISAVKVFWEFAKSSGPVSPQGAVPDEGYEWKVLTAYVETARGRTVLRGSRPPDMHKFTRDALLQSAASAIVGGCMSHVRRPHLWTRKTVDEILSIGCNLFTASLATLGYEFRPGEDVLHPLQVLTRFVLGVNYIRYQLESALSGKLEQREPTELPVKAALERFFETHTHGILWCSPHAVAVWRVAGAPPYYMMEPHACGPTGLRIDAQDDGAACVLTFTSPKLMAYAYLQNIPASERPKLDYVLYALSVTVHPIRKMKSDPPLVRMPPGVRLVPATSKVGVDGRSRRADERDRQHPPGSATCLDAQKAADDRDRDDNKYKGQRNSNGWLVLSDGTQFLSATHSMACKRFPYASRGKQALPCCVMAVAMSRVEDVCRWCSSTLDQVLDSGDQLFQDSYLHYRPKGQLLTIEQVLRKFYTPGNCVCRVVVYQSRQEGSVDKDLHDKLTEFFREEKAGVFVAGSSAVALFKTPRGFYMFDPADRDRYGRAVAPPCVGKARACFSQYPSVKALADKLGANIPPMTVLQDKDGAERPADSSKMELRSRSSKTDTTKPDLERRKSSISKHGAAGLAQRPSQVHFEAPAEFKIYGMGVSSLRRLNQHEK